MAVSGAMTHAVASPWLVEHAITGMRSITRMRRSLDPTTEWHDGRTVQVATDESDLAMGNCVFVPRDGVAEPDLDEVEAALTDLAALGRPFSLLARSGVVAELEPIAVRHGLAVVDASPLMVLEDLSGLPSPPPPELSVRFADTADYDDFLRCAADAFETTPEIAVRYVKREAFETPQIGHWIGWVDDSGCVASNIVVGEWVAIFDVATPPPLRRRGYGAAMTAAAVQAGFAAGARYALLNATPDGLPLYARLGFQTVDTLTYWETSSD